MNKAAALILVLIIAVTAICGITAYETWMDYTGKADIRRLEAAAAVAEANAREAAALAEALRNQADLERAMGEHALKTAEGEAIKAPAKAAAMAVRTQSLIVGFWSMVGPVIIIGVLMAATIVVIVWILRERIQRQHSFYARIDRGG